MSMSYECLRLLLSYDCHMLLYLLSAMRARCGTTMLSRMRKRISGYQRSIALQPLVNWSSTTNPMEEVCVTYVGRGIVDKSSVHVPVCVHTCGCVYVPACVSILW